jgi:signal transduction histidine kinase
MWRKLDLYIEKCDAKDLLDQIIDLISYEANQKKLHLELNLASDIQNILGRYCWLKQILINLLAVKFTEKEL